MLLSSLRPTLTMLTLLTVLLGGAYPGVCTLLLQALFPEQARGSMIRAENGQIRGSRLIGQSFSSPEYFWSRPSAAHHDGAASTGSNLGAANPALLDVVQARVAMLKAADPEDRRPIPVDLVTSSASGLDPHISVAGAEYQVERIATARNIDVDDIRAILRESTHQRQFGVLGNATVNVLELNLALDARANKQKN